MAAILGAGSAAEAQGVPPGPNILLILTDDQEASTLEYMPNLQAELAQQGTTFENAIFTYPLCCPSRATIFRGQYPHNTGIVGNEHPYGGWPAFKERGLDESNLGTWMDEAGYDTGYFGKLMNEYGGTKPALGFDRWVVYNDSRGPGWSGYTNGKRSRQVPIVKGEGVIKRRALSWLGAEREEPFFGVVAFWAPHAPSPHPKGTNKMFRGVKAPRNEAFNEADVSDKPGWVRELKLRSARQISDDDEAYRDSLRSLVRVDNFIGEAIEAVPSDTYVIYWTDNGTHRGYHRLGKGKRTPYEQDINVPMYVRGPGVHKGTSQKLVGNHDLAPTIADLAGLTPPDFVDGRSFAPLLSGDDAPWRDALLVTNDASDGKDDVPSWAAIRTEASTYVEYETGERELYDLSEDPYQTENLLAPDGARDAGELPARLETLKGCGAEKPTTCPEAEGP